MPAIESFKTAFSRLQRAFNDLTLGSGCYQSAFSEVAPWESRKDLYQVPAIWRRKNRFPRGRVTS